MYYDAEQFIQTIETGVFNVTNARNNLHLF